MEADRRGAAAKTRSFAEVVAAPPTGGTGGGGGGSKKKNGKAVPPPVPQQGTPAKRGAKRGGAKVATGPKAPIPVAPVVAVVQQPVAGGSEWTEAGPRRGKKGKKGGAVGGAGAHVRAPAAAPKKAPLSAKAGKKPGAGGKDGRASQARGQPVKPRKIRPPRQAAVLISAAPVGEGERPASIGEVIAGVRSSIKLADFGIASLKPKKAVGGGILFEIPGQESGAKADKLAAALRPLLEPKGVRVARPVKLAELRVTGLDDSVAPEKVREAVAGVGGCLAGEVSVGRLNRSPAGRLGTVWARCPAVAAKKVVDAGPLTVGWVKARVEALGARPLQCYRCLGFGHTRANCRGETDRSGLCYRCGQSGHKASECSAEPRCPYCTDKGLKAEHRYGGEACASLRPEKKVRKKVGKGASAPSTQVAVGDKGVAQPTLERPPQTPEPDKGPVDGQEEAMDTA